ncbi:MAG: chemotaxis protein CheW [Ilumatobacteraceae bacterium]
MHLLARRPLLWRGRAGRAGSAHGASSRPWAPPVVQGLMNLRGLILTAIDLRRRMGFDRKRATPRPASWCAPTTGQSACSWTASAMSSTSVRRASMAPDAAPGSVMEFITGAYKLEDVLLLELDTKRVIADPTALAG